MKWWQQQTQGTRIILSIVGVIAALMLIGRASLMSNAPRPVYSQDTQQTIKHKPVPAPTRVTRANYERLREGMKESEVIAILGPVGEVKAEMKEPSGSSAAVYQWGSAGEGFIILTMGDEKLVAKSQVSLKH